METEKELLEILDLRKMSGADKQRILKRGQGEVEGIYPKVQAVIDDVRENGDAALLRFMKEFDGVELAEIGGLQVSRREIKAAYAKAGPKLVKAIEKLADQVLRFHELQKPRDWFTELSPGMICGQTCVPLESVGCYAPGGRGWFPSTILMTVLPARAAGVRKIVVCTPPQKDGSVNAGCLVAADVCGVNAVFKLSGAQAIAAMAFGTKSVPRVQKIAGPGGAWVVAAKTLLQNEVAIDMPAGPGEGLVLADETANPDFVAADVIIQAEHGNDSAGVVVTTSKSLAKEVRKKARERTAALPEYRRAFVETSLRKYGAIIVARDMDEAIDFVNDYAVEHLEIACANPMQVMKRISNAGAFYLGNYAPLSAGCFCSGPNHTLPTAGKAKLFGGLKTEDFIKKISFEYFTRDGLGELKDAMLELARFEGFPAHGNAIAARFEEKKKKEKNQVEKRK